MFNEPFAGCPSTWLAVPGTGLGAFTLPIALTLPAGLYVDPLALDAALWFRCGMGKV